MKAELSPDESILAVLSEDTSTRPPKKSLQIFTTGDGRRAAQWNTNVDGTSDFVFAENGTLFFTGARGITAFRPNDGNVLLLGNSIASALAVSEDGQTVVSLRKGGDSVCVYRGVADSQTSPAPEEFSLEGFPWETHGSLTSKDALFALNETGNWLAMGVPGNNFVRLFYLAGATPDNPLPYCDLPLHAGNQGAYQRLEGGFSDLLFVFAASAEQENGSVISEWNIYRLDETFMEKFQSGQPPERYMYGPESAPVHTRITKEGVYLAIGNRVSRVNAAPEAKSALPISPELDGKITNFLCAGSHFLAETAHPTIFIMERHNGKSETISDGVSYSALALGEQYLTLFNEGERALAVWRWEEPWRDGTRAQRWRELFQGEGAPTEADNATEVVLSYDRSYEHQYAHLHRDGTSAMLYTGRSFRIFYQDAAALPETEIPDWQDMDYMQYRLHPQNIEEESLEIHYHNGERTRRINAKTGLENLENDIPREDMPPPRDFPNPDAPFQPAFDGSPSAFDAPTLGGPAEPDRSMMTNDYVILYQPSGPVQIYEKLGVTEAQASSGQPALQEGDAPPPQAQMGKFLKEISGEGNFVNAEQEGEYLILSFSSPTAEQRSQLLNRDLEVIANLYNLCDIRQGSFVFDDFQGHLIRSHIYSLDELIALAVGREA